MVTERDLELAGGRRLHIYDTGAPGDADSLAVFWHHGTPNIGAPPEPLLPASARLGVRWVSHDRPGYGGSTRRPGRDVASAAADVAAVADALGIERFAVMGHSGGGAHALACGTCLPERVIATVCVSGLAPLGSDGLDWFAGMAASGAAELQAAVEGQESLAKLLASTEFDMAQFTPADMAALTGPWRWLGAVADLGLKAGPGGMIDDDLATVGSWGFEPTALRTPVLFLHGLDDRIVPASHSRWLADRISPAELWLRPGEGHISVLNSAEAALAWLCDHAGRASS